MMPLDPAVMTPNLFEETSCDLPLADGAVLLGGFARSVEVLLLEAIETVVAKAPFRHMLTPGGYHVGRHDQLWRSRLGHRPQGYRYAPTDPDSGEPWPAMPLVFADLAARAAVAAGFDGSVPDSCLINRYEPGARLSLHQDRNERDFDAPIVSVSLGLPAVFLFGGQKRSDRPRRVTLAHGDVVVWGGPARMTFHGVMPLADGEHAVIGRRRINVTFRRAL